jgi:hypothetical protein
LKGKHNFLVENYWQGMQGKPCKLLKLTVFTIISRAEIAAFDSIWFYAPFLVEN